MSKKPKLTVWNKKQSKISSTKILKTKKSITKIEDKDSSKIDSPMANFVKKLDEQIRNACKE